MCLELTYRPEVIVIILVNAPNEHPRDANTTIWFHGRQVKLHGASLPHVTQTPTHNHTVASYSFCSFHLPTCRFCSGVKRESDLHVNGSFEKGLKYHQVECFALKVVGCRESAETEKTQFTKLLPEFYSLSRFPAIRVEEGKQELKHVECHFYSPSCRTNCCWRVIKHLCTSLPHKS